MTPRSGLAGSRSTRAGGLRTRRLGARPARPVVRTSPYAWDGRCGRPTPAHSPPSRGGPPGTACGAGGPGRDAEGHALSSTPNQMPEGSCRDRQPPGGDAGQPRTPAQSCCPHPSFGGGEKNTRVVLRASDRWPVRQRSPRGVRGQEGSGDAADRREEATSASPVLCAGPATRPRGWGSAGRPGG